MLVNREMTPPPTPLKNKMTINQYKTEVEKLHPLNKLEKENLTSRNRYFHRKTFMALYHVLARRCERETYLARH
jgi:hypothetical protein